MATIRSWRGGERRALNTWIDLLRKAERRKLVMMRWAQYSLYRLWHRWSVTYAARIARLRVSVTRMANAVYSRAFNSWSTKSAVRRIHLNVLLRGIGALSMRLQRTAFNTWYEKAMIGGLLLRRCRSVVAALMGSKVRNGWNTWLETAASLSHRHALLTKALSGFSPTRKAWNAWFAKAFASRLLLRRARSALETMAGGSLRKAWNAWVDTSVRRAQEQQRLLRALSGLTSPMRKAWNAWSDACERWSHSAALLNRAVAGLASRLLWAINAWRSSLEPDGALVNRAVGHLAHRLESKAWRAWIAMTDERFQLLAVLNLSASAFASVQARRVVNSWLEYCEVFSLQRRSLSHLLNRELSRGFTSWLGYREMLLTARRALSGMVQNGLIRGLNKWVLFAEERQQAIARMHASLGALKNGSLQKAFNNLVQLVRGPPNPAQRAIAHMVNAEVSRGLRAWLTASAALQKMKGAITSLLLQQLKRSLMSWIDYAKGRAEAMRVLRSGLSAATDARRKCWNTWVANLEGFQALRSALARLMATRLVKCINSWIEMAAEQRKKRSAYRRFLRYDETAAIRIWHGNASAAAEARNRARMALRKLFPEGRAILKALNSWSEFGKARATARSVACRMRHRNVLRTFNTWYVIASQTKADQQRLQKVLYALSPEGKAIRAAYNQLCAQLDTLRRMRRALARMTLMAVVRSVNKWHAFTGEMGKVRSAMARLTNRELSKGFSTWVEWLEIQQKVRQATSHLFNRELSRAFASWVDCIEHLDKSYRALAHLASHELSRGFASWIEYHRLLLTARRALHGMRGNGLLRGLNKWVVFAAELAHATDVLQASLGAMRDGALKRCFNTWADLLRGPVDPAARAMAHMVQRELALGFRSWSSFVRQRGNAARTLSHAVGHWRNMKIARCMNNWEAFLRNKMLLRRAGAALFNTQARACLFTWICVHRSARDTKEKLEGTVRRFSAEGRALIKGFNAWKGLLAAMQLVRRAAVSFMQGAFVRAFRKFAAVAAVGARLRIAIVRMQKANLVRAIITWRKAPQRVDPAKRAAARLLNQPTAKAFEKWVTVYEMMQFLRRSASHLANRSLAAAWRSWEEFVQQREMMHYALGTLFKLSLRKGINTWASWADARAEKAEKIAASLTSMLSPMRGAFNSWRAAAFESKGMGRTALGHLTNRVLSVGFNTWLRAADARERTRAALAHLTGRELVKALGSWEEYVESQHMLRQSLASFFNRVARTAMSTWFAYIEGRLSKLAQLRGTLSAFLGPQKKAVNTWLSYVDQIRSMRHALARLAHISQARAFTSWTNYAEARVAHKNRMRSALASITSGLRMGLNSWYGFAVERRLALVALTSLTMQSHRQAFNKWDEFTNQAIAMREHLATALGALISTDLRKGFNSWLAMLARLDPLRRSLAHLVYAAAAKAIATWINFLEQLESKRRALSHVMNHDLSKGLRSWVAFAKEREQMRGVLASMVHHAAKRVLRRWAQMGAEREERLRRMRGTLYSLAGGHQMLKAVNSWKDMIQERQRAIYALSAFVHGARRRAWNVWADIASRERDNKARMASALMFDERKAFNSWHDTYEHVKYSKRALRFWKGGSVGTCFMRWARNHVASNTMRRAGFHFRNMGAARAWNSWMRFLREKTQMRRAMAAFAGDGLLKGLNKWAEFAILRRERCRRAVQGASAFLGAEARRAWNTWTMAVSACAPIRKAMMFWMGVPEAKAWFKWRRLISARASLRQKLYRLANQKLSRGMMSWKAWMVTARKKRKIGSAFRHPGKRRGFNTWIFYLRGRRRLRGLVYSWKYGVRAGFNKWRAMTRRRSIDELGSPTLLRSIRPMTWRESCVWLQRVGIPVSRSPPTLLRTLRQGTPYQMLVRRILPTFWVRHKMADVLSPAGVFNCLQQFFETEQVVRVVGCQRLDVRALEEGKAIEHLELLANMHEILEDALERAVARRGIVYAPDD